MTTHWMARFMNASGKEVRQEEVAAAASVLELWDTYFYHHTREDSVQGETTTLTYRPYRP